MMWCFFKVSLNQKQITQFRKTINISLKKSLAWPAAVFCPFVYICLSVSSVAFHQKLNRLIDEYWYIFTGFELFFKYFYLISFLWAGNHKNLKGLPKPFTEGVTFCCHCCQTSLSALNPPTVQEQTANSFIQGHRHLKPVTTLCVRPLSAIIFCLSVSYNFKTFDKMFSRGCTVCVESQF